MKYLAQIAFVLLALAANVFAASDTPFPADWAIWNFGNATLTEIGALPDCAADASLLPLIYQKTVDSYCSVIAVNPGNAEIFVKPSVLNIFESRDENFPDGPTMILHVKDIKVLFVTGSKIGSPVYGVYTEAGNDIADAGGTLSIDNCNLCHFGY